MTDHHHHEHDHDHDHEHEHEHHHDHDHDHEHHHHHELSAEEYLVEYRAAVDEGMREDPNSPIPADQRESFKGLSYYPFNPEMHMHLPLDREVSEEPVVMETSTGDSREFLRAGKIHFDVNGQEAELTVYASPDGDLFLPMRDATSGKETYGAGRYLQPERVDEDGVHVDFNYLYNPYCAYNEAYSCPLPPIENWLRVPIEAGEKVYKSS